ncbi:MAG: hypothetical protein KDC88_15110, partial [Ignavibacteriae bacterium]|nr:hypothetical protein [Ignavibacteriota bacterium]
GPVIFDISNGTYNEQLDFYQNITGTSSTNTVTFQSLTGNASDVEISFAASGSADNYIIRINEAQYLIFKNLTFRANNVNYSQIVYSINPRGNLTFTNNVFNGRINNNGNIIHIEKLGSGNLDNLVFTNNTFNEGEKGIFLSSQFAKSNNLNISGNSFFYTNNSEIDIFNFTSPYIRQNNIAINNSFNNYAIKLNSCDGDFIIAENNIYSTTPNECYGISFSNCNSTGTTFGTVYNNFIQVLNWGIYISNSNYIKYYFNSINIYNGSLPNNSNLTAFENTNSTSNLLIQNNIFNNEMAGYAYKGNSGTNNISDYNNFYTNGTILTNWNGTYNNTTLADFQSKSGTNSNSYNEMVTFTNHLNLHVANSLTFLEATFISTITMDGDGDIRKNPTFIGADEFIYPLRGTYTIGNTGQYNTISDAVNDLYSWGIVGPVTFNIFDGSYNEQIDLNGNITGSSTTNTVTFKSNSGNPGAVEIHYAVNTGDENYILRISEATNLIFKDLTFTSNGVWGRNRVVISEAPKGNLSFQGNIFNGRYTPFDAAYTLVAIATYSALYNLNNLEFINNIFNNGSYGLVLENVEADEQGSQRFANLIISNNIFNSNSNGMNIKGFDSPIISNNSLDEIYYSGIAVSNCDNNVTIKENIINVLNTSNPSSALKVTNLKGTYLNYGKIINNFIHANKRGIVMYGCDFVEVYFNTVNIEDELPQPDPTTYAVYQELNNYLQELNNIFVNNAGGYSLISESETGNLNDYNNLYTNGPNLTKLNNTNYSDLDGFRIASNTNLNSYSSEVQFFSSLDLHIKNSPVQLLGTPISAVSTDYDGDSRNNPPFIGADEPETMQVSLTVLLEGP